MILDIKEAEVVDYDKHGYCCLCHCKVGEMKVYRASDGEEIKQVKWFHNKRTVSFRLNDGGQLMVNLCDTCDFSMTEGDMDSIMESVKRGWWKELESLLSWSQERKEKYRETYSKLQIKGRG